MNMSMWMNEGTITAVTNFLFLIKMPPNRKRGIEQPGSIPSLDKLRLADYFIKLSAHISHCLVD